MTPVEVVPAIPITAHGVKAFRAIRGNTFFQHLEPKVKSFVGGKSFASCRGPTQNIQAALNRKMNLLGSVYR